MYELPKASRKLISQATKNCYSKTSCNVSNYFELSDISEEVIKKLLSSLDTSKATENSSRCSEGWDWSIDISGLLSYDRVRKTCTQMTLRVHENLDGRKGAIHRTEIERLFWLSRVLILINCILYGRIMLLLVTHVFSFMCNSSHVHGSASKRVLRAWRHVYENI